MSNIVKFEDALTKHIREVNSQPTDDIYDVIDIRWFSNNRINADQNEPIGIVLVEDYNCNTVTAIIGNGRDPQNIAAWGSKIDRRMAEGIFGYAMPNYKV